MTSLADDAPALRIVAGRPTDEEIAAVTTVLLTMGSGTPADTPPGIAARPTNWAGYWRDRAAISRTRP